MFYNPYLLGMLRKSVYFSVLTSVWSEFLSLISELQFFVLISSLSIQKVFDIEGEKSHFKEFLWSFLFFCLTAVDCYM